MNYSKALLRCIVVEDEPENQAWLCERLSEMPNVEVVGSAASVNEAFLKIVEVKPNGLFLDIKLKGGNAFNLLEKLQRSGYPIPPSIIITGMEEGAGSNAIRSLNDWRDCIQLYLAKPYMEDWEEKLDDCVLKLIAANNLMSEHLATPPQEEFIFVKDGHQLRRILYDELLWLEVAGGGSIFLVTEACQIKRDITLAKMVAELPPCFFQISRDKVVNLNCVIKVDRRDRGVIVPYQGREKFLGIGDAYYAELIERLGC